MYKADRVKLINEIAVTLGAVHTHTHLSFS